MYLRLLILAVLASSAMATDFNTCQNGAPPLALRVVGCDQQPCVIQRQGEIDAQADFQVSNRVSRLVAKVRATLASVTTDYPLPEPNACNTLVDSSCPLESGDIATYRLSFRLPPYVPAASVVVELRVINPDGVGPDGGEDIMFCFNIRVDVVENRKI